MMTLLHLGNEIVNLEHVVRAQYTPLDPGGEEKIDPYTYETYKTRITPAKVVLTLTAVELTFTTQGYNEMHLGAASASQTVTVEGDEADELWRFLTLRSVILEPWTDEAVEA